MYLFIYFNFVFQKDSSFLNMFYNENNFLIFFFCLIGCSPPILPKDFFNKNGTSHGPPQQLPWPPCPALPCLPCPVCH
jgi:hypothetical protein